MTLSLGFYGGAGTVTGSRFLLDTAGRRLLIDCGLFQGLKPLRLLNWQPTPFDPRSVDAVILTHAHIDHSGYLPRLVKAGFSGPIYCTSGTQELAEILLPDAARIQEEDAEYANRKGFSKHHPALPLFTEAEAHDALTLFEARQTDFPFEVAGASVAFRGAGHILGAAFIELHCPVDSGEEAALVFSGDLGRYDAPLHTDPAPLPECDTLILESTYGDRNHPADNLAEQLRQPLQEAIRRQGTILIPAFAVARAQLVMLLLRQLMESGELPTLPIHIDSPMAVDVTGVYRRHLGSEDLDVTRHDLFPQGVRFHRTQDQSKALNHMPGPRVIIAASGMMTGGRVLHHLRRLAPDPRNLVVLVGFQAAGTRGRALLEGARTLRMHGLDVPVRAQLIHIEGLSAHADRDDLLRWVSSGPRLPASVFLTHGEPPALESLAAGLRTQGVETIVPALNRRFESETPGVWRQAPPFSAGETDPERA